MNKNILIATLALALIAVTGAYSINKVYAEDTDSRFGPFLQALIEKFGLNEDEVQSFVEEQREVRHQEVLNDLNEKLDTAVTEGKLTQEQKESLLALIENHRTAIENDELTVEERRELMAEHRDAMQTWAQENGVGLYDLNLGWGHHMGGINNNGDGQGFGGHGQGMGMHMGW